jgi:two-component system sensor histidine kinase BaeS
MLSAIRRHLSWKLFLSYLVIILVGIVVLSSAGRLALPTAYERHMATMVGMMGGEGRSVSTDLFANFVQAVTEALILATLAELGAVVIASVFFTRQIVLPVQEMMAASQRIADGHYDERVDVPGSESPEEMDELGLLAASFNQMAARLEQTEAMRRDLIGDVAHELRTPLSSIKGYMEGLIDGVLPADAATYQQLYREADRLERLVHDLQELSRVESGAFELDLEPIPVAHLFEVTVDRLGRQFEEKGVALEVGVPAGLPPVRADEDRIGQVLLNLVGNALQYTPPGGRVKLRASRTGGLVRLTVEDTGIGIPAEDLLHVFERFYRVDKSRSRARGGSGVGLTIARYLVEAHGGEIRASSEGPGRGSTFQFTLPVA